MAREYAHLTFEKRQTIESMNNEGRSATEIAKAVDTSDGTIYRELKRGYSIETGRYEAMIAEASYRSKLSEKGMSPKVIKDKKLASFIEKRIVDDEISIAEVVEEINKSPRFKTKISVQSIYSAIDLGLFSRLTRSHLPSERIKAERGLLQNLIAQKMEMLGIVDVEELAGKLRQKRLTGEVLEKKIESMESLTYRDLRLLAETLQFTDDEIISLFRQ